MAQEGCDSWLLAFIARFLAVGLQLAVKAHTVSSHFQLQGDPSPLTAEGNVLALGVAHRHRPHVRTGDQRRCGGRRQPAVPAAGAARPAAALALAAGAAHFRRRHERARGTAQAMRALCAAGRGRGRGRGLRPVHSGPSLCVASALPRVSVSSRACLGCPGHCRHPWGASNPVSRAVLCENHGAWLRSARYAKAEVLTARRCSTVDRAQKSGP